MLDGCCSVTVNRKSGCEYTKPHHPAEHETKKIIEVLTDSLKIQNNPMADWDTSEKSKLLQPVPPPYQEQSQYPNAGYPPPGSYPSTSGYQSQQYGAPVGPYNQGPYPGHPAVTVQPAVYVTAVPLINPPPDYLVYSIFTMLCCCLPLGIAALVYSISTRDAIMSGHREVAESSSRTARLLNNIALGIGITAIIVYVTCVIVVTVNNH